MTVNAFYEQGVRFLDVSDPKNLRQVGYYRQDDSNTVGRRIGTARTPSTWRTSRAASKSCGSPGRGRPATVSAPRLQAAVRDIGLRFSRKLFGGSVPSRLRCSAQATGG